MKVKFQKILAGIRALIYLGCAATLIVIVVQGFQRHQEGESKQIVKTLPTERMPIIAFTGHKDTNCSNPEVRK